MWPHGVSKPQSVKSWLQHCCCGYHTWYRAIFCRHTRANVTKLAGAFWIHRQILQNSPCWKKCFVVDKFLVSATAVKKLSGDTIETGQLDGLMQDCSISIVNTMEILRSCIKHLHTAMVLVTGGCCNIECLFRPSLKPKFLFVYNLFLCC